MEDYKISLHRIEKDPTTILPYVSYMIKVPNFFTLPEIENEDNEIKISSTLFEFANATWQFQFKSEKQLMKTGRLLKTFKVSLETLTSELVVRVITLSILLLDADNKMHDSQHTKCIFDDNSKHIDLCFFRNDNPFFDRREKLTLIIELICDEMGRHVVEGLPSKGIEETEDYRISLTELPRRTHSSANYILKVSNFFNTDCNSAINSQPFEFCNASWQFKFVASEKSNGTFSLYLERLNSEVRKHLISYTILLCDEGYETAYAALGLFIFKENVNYNCAWTLSKELYNSRHNTFILKAFLISVEPLERHVVQNSPKKQLQEDFERLFLNRKNCDLTLKVAEKEFRVHKNVLMARSPVFEAMLSCNMSEKNKCFINVPDCDPRIMELFLFYVYCGKLDILNIDDAIDLYYIADKYDIALLKKKCSEFMMKSFSPQMICDVVKLSINHSDSDLLEYATEYFGNHMHEIFATPKWMSFLRENETTANELFVKTCKKWKSIWKL